MTILQFKTKLIVILVVVLGFFSSNSFAGEPITKQNTNEMSWDQQFYLHLLHSENTDLQAYGALYLSPSLSTNQSDLHLHKVFRKVVKSLSENEALSPQAMFIMTAVCHSNLESDWCDRNQLIARRLERFPDDMMVYLDPINQAVMLGIEGEVIDWVRQMAAANEFGQYFHYSDVYEAELLNYVEKYPFSESMIDKALEQHLQWYSRDQELNAEFEQSLRKKMPEIMLLMKKIGAELAMPISPYKGLIDACKSYQELSEDCLLISEKMATYSQEYIGIIIGLAIPEKMYEAQGKIQKYEEALARKELKKSEVKCLGQLVTGFGMFAENTQDLTEQIQVSRDQGERAGMIYRANLLYQQALSAGEESAELKNPASCLVD